MKAKRSAVPKMTIKGDGEPQFNPAQIKKRLANLNELRDIRTASAMWQAGQGELNENGKEVMRAIYSAVCTVTHVYCTSGFREELEALVRAHLEGREPPATKLTRLLKSAAPYVPHGETLRLLIDDATKGRG